LILLALALLGCGLADGVRKLAEPIDENGCKNDCKREGIEFGRYVYESDSCFCLSEDGGEVRLYGVDESVPTPTPTLQPGEVRATESNIDIDAYIDDWLNSDEWLTEQYTILPESDTVVFINWPHSILVTDAFSQTTVIAGPATVRFSDEEE